MGCEALTRGDLDGDGHEELVVAGRGTGTETNKMTVKVYLLEDDIEKNNFKRPELISTLFLQKLVQGPLGFVPHDEQCYKGNYDKHIRSSLQ